MEGTADEENPFLCKVDACCKVCKPGGCPTKGAGADDRTSHLASAKARAAGDFGTPQMQEHQAMFVVAYWTSVARMFISLGLNDKIVDSIVDEQGINTPHALSHLDQKGVEQLVSAIHKPDGIKDGTCNPGINVPLGFQEIIMDVCFTLKHQWRCRENFCPSLIDLEILEELWLQQEIKEAHDNKEAYNTWPIWDHKNCAAIADLIKQYFQQIWGSGGAPCAYLMHEHAQPLAVMGSSDNHAESFDDQMSNDQTIPNH